LFPTSHHLKEASHAATGGYTKAKTKGEEGFEEFEEDVASTFAGGRAAPVPGRNPMTQAAINHLLIPAAANVTKEIVKDIGFGEDKANMAKIAVWLPGMLLNNVSGPQYSSSLMDRGRNGMPANLQIDTNRFLASLQRAEARMNVSDTRTALARQQIHDLRADVAAGRTTVRDAMNQFDGTSALQRSKGMFELGRNDRNYARGAINDVKNVLRDEINISGGRYQDALQSWNNGVQAWSTVHQSRTITNFVEDVLRGPYGKVVGTAALPLFGVGGVGGAKIAPFVSGAGTIATPLAYKAGQIRYRAMFDPNLRQYYWGAINAASQQNAPVFLNYYNKLEKELETDSIDEKKKSKSK